MLKFYRPVTRAQAEAVFKVFCRDHPFHEFAGLRYTGLDLGRRRRAYVAFRRTFRNYGDYIGGPWCGMFLGIEKDGHTHS